MPVSVPTYSSPGSDGVLPDHPADLAGREPRGERLPGPAVVLGLVEVRVVVIDLVAGSRDVDRARGVGRRLDRRDQRPFGEIGRRHVLPRLPVVAGDVDQPVVAARPQDAALPRAFRERVDGAVVLGTARVLREGSARGLELGRILAREVRADGLPAGALVARPEDEVPRRVQRPGVVRREDDGERPREPVPEVLGAPAVVDLGPDGHETDLARAMVVALERASAARRAADRPDVDDVRVARMHGDVPALPGARGVAVAPRDAAVLGGARHAHARVVLLGPVDAVRVLVVDGHVIELRGELVVDRGPAVAAVERDARAAVVALDHPSRVPRIDPQVVVVAVGRRDLREGLPAVGRLPHPEVGDVDGVGVGGIREHVAVVPGAVDQIAVLGHELPRPAGVVGPVETGLLGLDDGPHAVRPRGGDRDADLPLDALRQPGIVRQVRPGVAPVDGLVEPAVRAAARERPEVPVDLPRRGVEDAGIRSVEGEVDRPGPFAPEEHALPIAPAVSGAEHAALGVRAEGVAQRRDVHEVRVLRMDLDPADVTGVGEAHVGPRLPAVGRLVDAVPVDDVDPDRRLAGASVDDVGVRFGHGERADGGRAEVAVRDVLPVRAPVGRLPHATRHRAEVEHHRLGRMPGDGDHAAAAGRADTAPAETLEPGCVHRSDLASGISRPPDGGSRRHTAADHRPTARCAAIGQSLRSRAKVGVRPRVLVSFAEVPKAKVWA